MTRDKETEKQVQRGFDPDPVTPAGETPVADAAPTSPEGAAAQGGESINPTEEFARKLLEQLVASKSAEQKHEVDKTKTVEDVSYEARLSQERDRVLEQKAAEQAALTQQLADISKKLEDGDLTQTEYMGLYGNMMRQMTDIDLRYGQELNRIDLRLEHQQMIAEENLKKLRRSYIAENTGYESPDGDNLESFVDFMQGAYNEISSSDPLYGDPVAAYSHRKAMYWQNQAQKWQSQAQQAQQERESSVKNAQPGKVAGPQAPAAERGQGPPKRTGNFYEDYMARNRHRYDENGVFVG